MSSSSFVKPVDHTYRDFSRYTEKGGQLVKHKKSEANFPAKLHKILSEPSHSHAIAWMPHGRAWKVIDKDELFSSILPHYYVCKKYGSFTRQLNGWGFKRLHQKGTDYGCFYHQCFLRGLPKLTCMIRRLPANLGKATPHPASEPNFYRISELFPVPPPTTPSTESTQLTALTKGAGAAVAPSNDRLQRRFETPTLSTSPIEPSVKEDLDCFTPTEGNGPAKAAASAAYQYPTSPVEQFLHANLSMPPLESLDLLASTVATGPSKESTEVSAAASAASSSREERSNCRDRMLPLVRHPSAPAATSSSREERSIRQDGMLPPARSSSQEYSMGFAAGLAHAKAMLSQDPGRQRLSASSGRGNHPHAPYPYSPHHPSSFEYSGIRRSGDFSRRSTPVQRPQYPHRSFSAPQYHRHHGPHPHDVAAFNEQERLALNLNAREPVPPSHDTPINQDRTGGFAERASEREENLSPIVGPFPCFPGLDEVEKIGI